MTVYLQKLASSFRSGTGRIRHVVRPAGSNDGMKESEILIVAMHEYHVHSCFNSIDLRNYWFCHFLYYEFS